ncbi:COG3650 family protein [Maricaulis parjimensis]|uniref:COG3650 family protein n=1 Tax=Maricaulis parjimensis TaxID=144023 RepID=UPI00193A5F54|nr:SH3 domain-containing protein [Maricaulis parjimensis]
MTITRILAVALMLALVPAGKLLAQPTLYRVVNVDAHDTLVIRATPSTTSAIIGTLQPTASAVEVLEVRHGWGRILQDEGSGWVSLAYLSEMPRPGVAGMDAPAGLQCSGTEPFWGLSIRPDGSAIYHDMMTLGEERVVTITDARTARSRFEPFIYYFTGEIEGMALIRPGRCSDGMSDRDYGWQAVVDARDGEGARLMEGCCRTPVQND